MENFIAYNPTKLHFGKNVVRRLGKAVSEYGDKVLLIYGQGSIKRNGIYDTVMQQLVGIGAEVTEFSGIRPNPVIEDVDAAARLGRDKGVDVIVAVGGGSVCDSAKVISVTIPVTHSGWDFYAGTAKPRKAVPLITVLTLAATGSEMNSFAVVQNNRTRQKLGWGHELLHPRQSFLDPQYTFTVPRDYTAYGIADLIAHCLEAFFGEGDAPLSDKFVYAIIHEAVENGKPLLENPHDYELRARIMYAATEALNTMTFNGRRSGDWGVHDIGHVLSLLYDIPHGASLSLVYPAWFKFYKNKIPARIAELGRHVFGVDGPEQTIDAFESFFKSIECPVRLSELGIGKDKKEEIIEVMALNEVSGEHHRIPPEAYPELVELFL